MATTRPSPLQALHDPCLVFGQDLGLDLGDAQLVAPHVSAMRLIVAGQHDDPQSRRRWSAATAEAARVLDRIVERDGAASLPSTASIT
jgi:hypothetical protein